jgi:hypothetical protein
MSTGAIRGARVRRLIGATIVSALLLGALATPVGASAHGSARSELSTDDCEALQSIGDESDFQLSTDLFGKQAKALATALDDTASEVDDRKLRKALRTMAGFHAALGRAGNALSAARVALDRGKAYGKALKVFTSAQVECASASITVPPNLTLPGGVTIPSLPGGATIPSLPR